MCVCDWFVARRTNMATVSWLNAHGTANSKYNEGVEREDSIKERTRVALVDIIMKETKCSALFFNHYTLFRFNESCS